MLPTSGVDLQRKYTKKFGFYQIYYIKIKISFLQYIFS